MQVTFALTAMEAAKLSSRGVKSVCVDSSIQLNNLLQRFESLRETWNSWKDDRDNDYPELNNLKAGTERVMQDASLAVADVRIALTKASSVTMERLRIVQILRNTKKAIRAGQKITHMEGFKTWVLPARPPAGTEPSKEWSEDYDRRKTQNKKANAISERRKRPLQCCMYIALAFSQFLQSNDMVAEYESEVVCETFDRALAVDDGKTYEWSQLKDHCLARLHPPIDRWPRSYIPYKEEDDYVPLRVRNPWNVGFPIVTNQLHPKAGKYTRDHTPSRMDRVVAAKQMLIEIAYQGILASSKLSQGQASPPATRVQNFAIIPLQTPTQPEQRLVGIMLSATIPGGVFSITGTSSMSRPVPSNSSHQEPLSTAPTPTTSPWARQFRQLGLFFAGAGFMAASVAVSRRAVLRRQLESFPKFYASNRSAMKLDPSDRSLLAVEAFGLATLNVMSFGVFITGGLSWAFDLSSVTELRQRTRAALSKPGLVNPEDEKELEAMMDSLLAKLGMEKPTKPEEDGSQQSKKSNES
ncbi:hypothetical protein HJFPF1_04962 [Paramyrothecium foliicola]|nr:hypothetical protein HJFPF1_04962 [Paramyrothecium foliicola]